MKTSKMAILYDWDNTLVDTNPVCIASLNNFFKEKNIDKIIKTEDLREINNLIFEEYLMSHFDINQKEIVIKEYRASYNQCLNLLALLPHTLKFLEFFKSKQFVQGIISNKNENVILAEVKEFGVMKYFSLILGGDSAKEPKPNKSLMDLAYSKLSLDDYFVIFTGDSEVDIKFAKNCQIPIIFVGDNKNLLNHQDYIDNIIVAREFNFELEKIFNAISIKYLNN